MFIRLTRTKRLRAGWAIALAYLFCVMAPTLSFALPGGHAVAHCLTDGGHVHDLADRYDEAVAQHAYGDVHIHDHSDAQAHVHAVGDQHPQSAATALNDSSIPAKMPRAADGKCCGLMCVTALPAAAIDVAKPLLPKVVRVSESCRMLTDNALPRRYRPPIS
jgi:hypothetical protein